MEVVRAIVQHPLFGLIGFAVGILSLVVTFVLYRRGRRLKEPCWAIRSNNLVAGFTEMVPLLEIRYKDAKVENLTVSKVLFWNHGADTIKDEDVAEADPLRIEAVGSVRILDIKLLATNSKPSQFLSPAPSADQTKALLTFDFLDKNQGALLQVIHTGLSSSDITLRGTIKGAQAIVRRNIKVEKQEKQEKKPGVGWVAVQVAGGVFSAGFLLWFMIVGLYKGYWPVLAAVLLALIPFAVVVVLHRIQTWLPPGLEQYRDD